MPDTGFENLFVVAAIAFLAPLVIALVPGLRLPAVVLEILAGVVLGPDVLGVVDVDLPVQVLAIIGLAFLLFSVGLELDVRTVRGEVLRLSALGYVATLLLGGGVGLAASAAGWVEEPLLLAVALSATSLGLVVPVLKDAGQATTPTGRLTVAAATLADVAAVLLLTLLFSRDSSSVVARVVLLASFVGVVALTAESLQVVSRWRRLGEAITRLQDTTAEIRVRAVVVLLLGFVVVAERFGLETILGALLAGVVVGAIDRDTSTHPRFRTKLEAIGFGFLIPVFFVSSGIGLDVAGLVSGPGALVRMPVYVLALLAVRGLPAALFLGRLSLRETLAAGLLQATSLPFLVTASMIGVEIGVLSPVNAAALVAAGIISVLVFPVAALALLSRAEPPPGSDADRSRVSRDGVSRAGGSPGRRHPARRDRASARSRPSAG
jgi:Kef-type K+ transport system membrane component KefB